MPYLPKYKHDETLIKVREYIEIARLPVEEGGLGKVITTKTGLALFLGVNTDTIHEWTKLHEDFAEVAKEVMDHQHEDLVQGGLKGELSPAVTKMLLHKHGYSDKQEISGPNNSPVQVESWTLQGIKPKQPDS